MIMKSMLPLVLALTVTALPIAGCKTSTSTSVPSPNATGIVGTVQDYEDGTLFLRLDNGQTKEFKDWDNGVMPPDREVIYSKGRKCRIRAKRVFSDDIAAYGWFEKVTFFEWLEPHSSKFSPVYIH